MKLKMIINEKKYVEELIDSSTLPTDVSTNMMITYLTKYYYNSFCTLEELTNMVCDKMDSYHIDIVYYQRYIAEPRIRNIYNKLVDHKISPLRDYDYIPLYQSEYDNVMSCKSDKMKKVLFTIYILARFTNKYGWVYNSESDIYKLANTSKSKDNLLATMIQEGLVKCTKKVDDLKIGVELSDCNEDIVFKVYKLNNLGNQLLSSIKDGYRICECCGKLIKIKSKFDGSTKYCEKCADKILYYEKMNTKIITCVDCGKQILVSSKASKTIRCDECATKMKNEKQRKYMQEKRKLV